jgi:hypothetical protein
MVMDRIKSRKEISTRYLHPYNIHLTPAMSAHNYKASVKPLAFESLNSTS